MKRVFIASSTEAKEDAEKLKGILTEIGAKVTCWYAAETFTIAEYTLPTLIKQAQGHDAGLFILNTDDKILRKGKQEYIGRDNVLLEAGILAGY